MLCKSTKKSSEHPPRPAQQPDMLIDRAAPRMSQDPHALRAEYFALPPDDNKDISGERRGKMWVVGEAWVEVVGEMYVVEFWWGVEEVGTEWDGFLLGLI